MSNELNDDARSLIRDAIAAEPVADGARRAGLKRSLLARAAGLVAAAAATTGTTAAASVLSQGAATLPAAVPASVLPSAGAVSVLLAKGAAVGLIVGGALHAGTRFGHDSGASSSPSVAPARVLAPAPASHAPAAPKGDEDGAAPDEHTATPAPSAGSTPLAASVPPSAATGSLAGVRPVEPPPAGSGASLRAELELIGAVQAALRDGRPARALELVDRHAALYPRGQLETERLAAEAIAACRSGNEARGRRAARLFLRRDPSSALAARVRSACPAGGDDSER